MNELPVPHGDLGYRQEPAGAGHAVHRLEERAVSSYEHQGGCPLPDRSSRDLHDISWPLRHGDRMSDATLLERSADACEDAGTAAMTGLRIGDYKHSGETSAPDPS